MQTGPLLGDIATLNAFENDCGIFFTFLTVIVFLVIGSNNDCWSRP
jgi:hypothetical protein